VHGVPGIHDLRESDLTRDLGHGALPLHEPRRIRPGGELDLVRAGGENASADERGTVELTVWCSSIDAALAAPVRTAAGNDENGCESAFHDGLLSWHITIVSIYDGYIVRDDF